MRSILKAELLFLNEKIISFKNGFFETEEK